MRPKFVITTILLAIIIVLILARKSHQQLSEPIVTNNLAVVGQIAPGPSTTSVSTPPPPVQSPRTVQARIDEIHRDVEDENSMWKASLAYFGKVIDESNRPISGVHVSYGANSMDDSGKEVYNTGTVASDDRGFFRIEGVRGINLMVQLSHPDYYSFPDNPTGFDKRAVPRKGYFSDSEDTADVFRMHSKGHPVALVHRRGGMDVPANGSSVAVEFYGTQDSEVIGTLQIEAAGNTPKNWSPTPYDWSVRLTIPNGGLVEFTNQFDFVAPDSGYEQSVELDMKKNQLDWSDTIDKSYFVKLPNGYLRMSIHIRAKTPIYTSLEYYYNPDGSQDLEPAQ